MIGTEYHTSSPLSSIIFGQRQGADEGYEGSLAFSSSPWEIYIVYQPPLIWVRDNYKSAKRARDKDNDGMNSGNRINIV
jgi:hypothetical protein